MGQGQKIGILENDYGAVNVDRMLLQDLEGPQCSLEMIAGGCGPDCHRRRFRTKLIAMGMLGYDRVLVEPSGVYDVDEFFDALCESPLDRWYEPGSVLAVLDANLEQALTPGEEYLLASEAAGAGCVVLSRYGQAGPERARCGSGPPGPDAGSGGLRAALCLRAGRSGQRLAELTGDDFARLAGCGWRQARFGTKRKAEGGFASLALLSLDCGPGELRRRVQGLWADESCGRVFRVKGFVQGPEGWLEVNATPAGFDSGPSGRGRRCSSGSARGGWTAPGDRGPARGRAARLRGPAAWIQVDILRRLWYNGLNLHEREVR